MFKCKHKKVDYNRLVLGVHEWGFCKKCNKAVVRRLLEENYKVMPLFDK